MNHLIPIEYYTPLYFHTLLFFVVLTLLHALLENGNIQSRLLFHKMALVTIMTFVILFMGLRPISNVFVDMITYENIFQRFQHGTQVIVTADFGFYYFMETCAANMNATLFFMLCSLIYIVPAYMALRKWFPNYTYLGTLAYMGALAFWAYGTNGIRTGMAVGLTILGMAYTSKKWVSGILFLIALSFHASMILPVSAFLITRRLKKTHLFVIAWAAAVILSLTTGSFWEKSLTGLGVEQERIDLYTNTDIARWGYRWDFLLYSAIGVFAGIFYIFNKKFDDPIYVRLFNTYLLSNTAWILIIRVNYTNRFAYLSWFMMSIIIIYPLLKKTMFGNQYLRTSLTIFFYYIVTYILNVFIAG